MILFRGLSLLTIWYIVYVMESPFFFDIHLHAEDHCATIKDLILEHFNIYIEHPLYFIILATFGFLLYAIGAVLDSAFAILSILGVTATIGYFFFFS